MDLNNDQLVGLFGLTHVIGALALMSSVTPWMHGAEDSFRISDADEFLTSSLSFSKTDELR